MSEREPPDPRDKTFPPPVFPCVYADGVKGLEATTHTTKFYLYRIDSNFGGTARQGNMPHAQIIMPTNGFLEMVSYFNFMLDAVVKDGSLTQVQVEEVRARYAEFRARIDEKSKDDG